MTTNNLTHLQYSPTLTPALISEALQRYRNRGQQPVAVAVRPDSGVEAGEVDGVRVEIDERVKPVGHWWVVVE